MYKNKLIRICILSLAAVLIFFLLYLFFSQRTDNLLRVSYYTIDIFYPQTFDRLTIKSELTFNDFNNKSIDEISISLCKEFKGVTAANISILNKKGAPLDFSKNEHLITIKKPEKIIIIQYDLMRIKSDKDDTYADFAFLVSKDAFHINASITRTDNWYPRVEGSIKTRLPGFTLKIHTPNNFEVMASGKLHKIKKVKGGKIFIWKNYDGLSDRSLYFFGNTKRKKLIKNYDDKFKVIMYIPANSLNESIQNISNIIQLTYRYYNYHYGGITNDEYKIMAFDNKVMGYSGLFNSMNAPVNLFTKKIVNNEIYFPIRNIIHEVSHTWWGNIIAFDADKDYWMFEGFAKFSEITSITKVIKDADSDIERESFARLKLISKCLDEFIPPIMDASEMENRTLQVASAYYKGALFLNLLKFILGENQFYSKIKEYITSFKGKYADTEGFLKVIENDGAGNIKSTDLNSFGSESIDYYSLFNDYLYDSGLARYQLKKTKTIRNNSFFINNYEIRNVSDKDIYTILLVKSSIEEYRKKIKISKNKSYQLKIKTKIKNEIPTVVIDPEEVFPIWEEGVRGGGGLVYVNPKNDAKFTWVMEDSPFDKAGIKDNMTLLKINNQDTKGKDLHELNNLLFNPSGSEVVLMVKEIEGKVVVNY
jgi:hypothetical protein